MPGQLLNVIKCDQSHLYATTKEDLFFESVSDQCVEDMGGLE